MDQIFRAQLRENRNLRTLGSVILTAGVLLWTVGTIMTLAGGTGSLAVSIAGGLITGTGSVLLVGAHLERRGIERRMASARDRGYGLHW